MMRIFTFRSNLIGAFLLMSLVSFAQNVYQTVGLIGTSTPAGWDASTAMELANTSDPHQWTITLPLTQGEAKFRANDSWTVNWGGNAFPSGNGAQDGPNIQVPTAGYYTVTFNDTNGAYNFQNLNSPMYTTVGLVGNATPQGWDTSTAMTADDNDPHQWTLDTISLTQGEVKFRANDSWDASWGGSGFPGGTAFLNGQNIPVFAGEYQVTFNDVTGDYFFKNLDPNIFESVGIIGSSTSKGWDSSIPMKLVSAGDPNNWVLTSYLQTGELKFRANDNWDVNWGGSEFPAGTAVLNGPNMQIAESGYYTIRFNDRTGSYTFEKLNPPTYGTVGLIGTATTNGWDASTAMTQGTDGHTWTLTDITLFSGEAKFRANNAWDVNWGATDFPSGTGVQGGPNIPVGAGTYNVAFNDVTGDYNFKLTGVEVDPIVLLIPEIPTADDSVTIIYDANQGSSGLRGSEKVYMHSGVVLSGPGGLAWSNVVGNWGLDDGIGEMTPVPGEVNKWQITIPSVREYYNIEEGVPVFRLAMVFRNANGSQTGRSATGGDIYVNIDAGDFVRFTAPTADEAFGLYGEQLLISAEASDTAVNITLEINEGDGFEVVAQVSATDTIAYRYTIMQSAALQIRVTAQLDSAIVTSLKSINVRVREANTVAALPEGMHNGINYDSTDATQATLVLLAPGKEFVYAVGDFNNWQINSTYQMNQTPDGEYFWINLDSLEPQKEYVYQYWVEGTVKIGDPYADKVADPFNDPNIPVDVYPDPVAYDKTEFGIATVLQTGQQSFQWTAPEVQGGQPAKENLVIYELLLRDFLGSHSYTDLADTLSYLKRLGVNAIELLPIMEFEGNESWGYNPSYLFAPDKYYGTKNDLKAFINKAHEEGFVVLLDMVLNHQFGQSPMVRMYFDEANSKPTPESPWFNVEPTHPFNVGYDFNHESAYTKRYVDDVNRYWLTEFNFDGYRFDLSKGFTQVDNPTDVDAWSAYDQSRINILTRMADVIWAADSDAYVILEHLAVKEEEKVLADYGMMLWGNMNFAYNSAMNGFVNTDLNWALSSSHDFNENNLVPYMESHDEERLMVRAETEGQSNGEYDIKDKETALDRVKLVSAFFYPLPGPKMLWQFGELGYDVSINYNGRTGNKPLPWGDQDSLHYDRDENRIKLYKATAAIINLVNDHSRVFEEGDFSWTPSGQFRRINVSHEDMDVTIAGNFGVTDGSMQPEFQHTGTWYDFFSGRAFEVTTTSASVALAAGEFHIYVDQPLEFPERGLVKTPIDIYTPTNLIAQVAPQGAVSLSWDDNSTGEEGHVIERRRERQSEFKTLTSVGEDVVAFTDTSTLDGVSYEYRVRVLSSVQPDSAYSNVAAVNLPLHAPSNLTAEAVNKKAIALQWHDNSKHEAIYIVERAEQQGNRTRSFIIIALLPWNTENYTDRNIRNGTEYRYRVRARDFDEYSAYSNEATVESQNQKPGASAITMYPNPASSVLNITAREDEKRVSVQIISLQGVVVKRFELKGGNSSIQLDVSSWREGLYIVESRSSDSLFREQLMIKR
jgi:1,4-alpha-glucan branching enzyme